MKNSKINIRYAQALFQLSQEIDLLEKVKDDMLLISDVCRNSRDFRYFLKSPVIRNTKKAEVMREIFGEKVTELTSKFLDLMVRKDREKFVPDIAAEFNEVYKDHKGILTVEVSTAVALDDKMRKYIIDKLVKESGKTIELIEKIDTSLIGGFVLKRKDKMYDASISRELENLRNEFDINLYVKEY